MASFTRAKAESILPGDFYFGYLQRPERLVILAVCCMLSRLYVGMIFVAIFTNIAVFHQVWEAWKVSYNLEHPEKARKNYNSLNSSAFVQSLRSLLFWTFPRQSWQYDVLSLILLIVTILAPLGG